MPYEVVTKTVGVGRWYNPRTWGAKKTLWKRVWDMGVDLLPGEVHLFVEDQLGREWRETEVERRVGVLDGGFVQ